VIRQKSSEVITARQHSMVVFASTEALHDSRSQSPVHFEIRKYISNLQGIIKHLRSLLLPAHQCSCAGSRFAVYASRLDYCRTIGSFIQNEFHEMLWKQNSNENSSNEQANYMQSSLQSLTSTLILWKPTNWSVVIQTRFWRAKHAASAGASVCKYRASTEIMHRPGTDASPLSTFW